MRLTNFPTGTQGLLLIDKLGAHIRFFDSATYKELWNFEVPVNPHDFVLSADHKTAYVPVYGDGVYGNNPHPAHEIQIVDLVARKPAGTIDVSPYLAPHGIQIDSAGMLYVACDLSRKLLVIDPKTRSIKDAIQRDRPLDRHASGFEQDLRRQQRRSAVHQRHRPKTRKMVGRVPAPNGTVRVGAPRASRASPDAVSVINLKEARVTANFHAGTGIETLTYY